MHNIATGKAASRPKTSHDALALGVSNGRRQASRAAREPIAIATELAVIAERSENAN